MIRFFTVLSLCLTLFAHHTMAQHNAKGDIVISNSWIRATVPSAKVSAGYMKITNNGHKPDRLIAVSASFADETQIHEMKVENDVMRMREIDGGLIVPAGGTVVLERGGLHVMFLKLNQQLHKGDVHKVSFEFEHAGIIEIDLPVDAVGGGHQ